MHIITCINEGSVLSLKDDFCLKNHLDGEGEGEGVVIEKGTKVRLISDSVSLSESSSNGGGVEVSCEFEVLDDERFKRPIPIPDSLLIFLEKVNARD